MPFVRTIRRRFFLAVEGESEQSFVKWLQALADANELNVHLQCRVLSGGGFSSMLRNAVVYREQEKKRKGNFEHSCLLLDEDRTTTGDWSIDRLRREASDNHFTLCCQTPNFEGLLLRLIPGNEQTEQTALTAGRQISLSIPKYQKPIDARTLAQKFSLDDLIRASMFDTDLRTLLTVIGLISG